jgi:hypothetical protein
LKFQLNNFAEQRAKGSHLLPFAADARARRSRAVTLKANSWSKRYRKKSRGGLTSAGAQSAEGGKDGLLKMEKTVNPGIRAKRFKADQDDDSLLKILNKKMRWSWTNSCVYKPATYNKLAT